MFLPFLCSLRPQKQLCWLAVIPLPLRKTIQVWYHNLIAWSGAMYQCSGSSSLSIWYPPLDFTWWEHRPASSRFDNIVSIAFHRALHVLECVNLLFFLFFFLFWCAEPPAHGKTLMTHSFDTGAAGGVTECMKAMKETLNQVNWWKQKIESNNNIIYINTKCPDFSCRGWANKYKTENEYL